MRTGAAVIGDSHVVGARLMLGTAGWNVPSGCREKVGGVGSHLERYAGVLNAVEINTSFYRHHRLATYEKWARATPAEFRFAVKMPRAITHPSPLKEDELDRFFDESAGLGEKLSLLLVQFPPSKRFDERDADALWVAIRKRSSAAIVCEPRHASWFDPHVNAWFVKRQITRVAADPARVAGADQPGGWSGLKYYRLHGSPRTYYSAYGQTFLSLLATRLSVHLGQGQLWCIFDNTAAGAALEDALQLRDLTSLTPPNLMA
jgi:uncharacterized protein YecE (DUF72 family)